MKDNDKTQKQLIKEQSKLRQRIAELEQSEIERKRDRQVFQTTNERLQSLLTSTSAAIYTSKTSGDYGATSITENVKQMTGYEPRDFIENSSFWLDHVHPEDRQRIVNELPRIFKKGKHIYEYRFQHKDGHYIWVRDDMKLIKDKSKNPIEIIGYWIDITARKQAEEELREDEEKYRNLIERANDGIGIAQDGILQYVNPRLAQMIGYPVEELINSPFSDFFISEEVPKVLDHYKRRMAGKKVIPIYETALKHKDNSRIDVEVNAGIITYKGKPADLVLVRDITERKRTQEALQENERFLASIFNDIQDGISILDKAMNIVRVNPVMEQWYAHNMPLVGKKCYKAYHDRNTRCEICPTWQTLQTGESAYEVVPKRGPEGKIVGWLDLYSFPMVDTATGEVQTVIEYVRDITERKRSEEAYQTIIRTAMDGFGLVDMQGHFTDVNEAYCSITGYSRDELLNMAIPDVEVIETPEDTAKRIRKIKEVGYGRFETRQRRKDGEIVDVEVSVKYVPTDGGRMVAFYRDITERKQAEEERQESEERFRLAFENANTGVCLVDLEGNLTRVNNKMCEIFGYTKEELEQMTVNDIAHPEDIDKSPEFIQETLQGKIHRGTFDKRYIHKKGHVVTCQVSSSLVRNAEGAPLYFISHVHDITSRKQAEEELHRSYQQMREMMVTTVNALAATVEMKDQYTAGHQPRATQLACAIAEEMGLPPGQIEGIRMAGSLHDIGKIVVPAEILNKPGPLAEVQYEMVKMHPRAGYDIVKVIKFPWPVAQIVLQHHELMDGSGYPQGLSGDQIMVEARILAVANVVEAMTSHRPYRAAHSIETALEEISRNKGKLYDPVASDACLKLFTEKRFTFTFN